MPDFIKDEQLNARLQECDARISKLVPQGNRTNEVEGQLKLFKKHYRQSFQNSKSNKNASSILSSYEEAILRLERVKCGELSAEKAVKLIDSETCSRKLAIVYHNIAKVCELLFWLMATTTCFSALIDIGIPLIFTQPLIGCAVSISMIAMMKTLFGKATNCLSQFKSFDRYNDEAAREKNLASFFQPAPAVSSDQEIEPINGPLYPDLAV